MDWATIAVFAFCVVFGGVFIVWRMRYQRRTEIQRRDQEIRIAKARSQWQREEANRLREGRIALTRQIVREELQKAK